MIKLEISELKPCSDRQIINRSQHIKRKVVERDKICQKCGLDYSEHPIHHILPLWAGGLDILSNCILLCKTCHRYAPNHPFKFMEYIKQSYSISGCMIPIIIRMYKAEIIKNSKIFPDGFREGEVEALLSFTDRSFINDALFNLNPNYKKCFWYRNSTNIWGKDDLNDLFDLAEISNRLFGNFYKVLSIREKLELKNKLRKDFFKLNSNDRKIKILQLTKMNPELSCRKIAIKLGIGHITVKKYLN